MASPLAVARNKRIVADIKELERAPVERAAAIPSDEDEPNVFHANVWPVPGSSWDSASPVHFVITCGPNYPFNPPSVQCMINYPHPNVVLNSQGRFIVCLDMLEPYTSTSRPYECWSSAFSIRSILVQLTSFILCDTSTDHVVSKLDYVRAMREADAYESKGEGGCGHSAKHPVPTCPTFADLKAAACSSSSTSLPVAVATSRFNAAMENLFSARIHSMTTSITTTAAAAASNTTLATIMDAEEKEDELGESEACDVSVDTHLTDLTELTVTGASITFANEEVDDEEEEEAWTVVKRTSCFGIANAAPSKTRTNTTTTNTKGAGRCTSPSLLSLFASGSGQPVLACSHCGKERRRSAFSRSQLDKGTGRRCEGCVNAAISSKSSTTTTPAVVAEVLDPAIIAHNASVVGYAGHINRPPAQPLSKKAEKHRRRKERALMAKLAKLNASKNDDEDEASAATATLSQSSTATVVTASTTAPTPSPTHTPTTISITPPSVAPSRMWTLGWGAGSATAAANLGAFKIMSRACTAKVMSFLGDHHTVLAWGTTCHAAAGAAEDNWIWQELLRQRFPHTPSLDESVPRTHTSVPPGSMKMSFVLEVNGLATEPSCFVTRVSRHDNEVLGFGVEHTSNPKTGVVDYITTAGDYLSASAYTSLKVRRSAWGENAKDFTAFLPVFLDKEHFETSGGHRLLILAARKLAPLPERNLRGRNRGGSSAAVYVPPHLRGGGNRSGGRAAALLTEEKAQAASRDVFIPKTEPEAALEMLLTMWKTLTIQIVDKGLAPSDKMLEVFCQIHRLMIALRERYPSLKTTIHARLHTFATNPASRCKSACPNLGQLIPLLVVSETYEWRHIAIAYLQESYDRSVLWACTKDSSLAKMDTGDESRIDRTLEATLVSQRMTAFNVSMVHLLRPPMGGFSLSNGNGNGKASSLAQARDSHDICLGRPPLHLRRTFHAKVRAVLEADSWGKVFECLRTALPPKRTFLSILESAVKNSLKKGYHDVNTRFDRIHRSGVSHILLKGQSYSAPPNLKRVRLTDRWKLDGDVDFLDASCLVYAGSVKIGMVDYSNTHWGANESATIRRVGNSDHVYELHNTSHDCVVHSGDMIDRGNNIGEHTIDIELSKLPKRVTALVFTISAWHGNLDDAIQPQCVLSDAGSKARTELCSYDLEGTGPRRYGAGDLPPTAAIMCTLTRAAPGASRWSMNAVGHQGQGRATGMSPGYAPMLQDIANGKIYEHEGGKGEKKG